MGQIFFETVLNSKSTILSLPVSASPGMEVTWTHSSFGSINVNVI